MGQIEPHAFRFQRCLQQTGLGLGDVPLIAIENGNGDADLDSELRCAILKILLNVCAGFDVRVRGHAREFRLEASSFHIGGRCLQFRVMFEHPAFQFVERIIGKRAIDGGSLKAAQIGRGWKVKRRDLESYIEEL